MEPNAYRIRPAAPADVPALMDMKLKLARAENAEHAVRATAQDWLRDGFGPNARFIAFVAEQEGVALAMLTCSERYYTGWPDPALYIDDLFVEPPHRGRGIARALLGRAAAYALARNCPMIELTVRDDNAALAFYARCGFGRVDHCVNYVAGQYALVELAGAAAPAQVA